MQDPGRIGERFLGQYTVITTSGTTGTPGIFVQDDRSMAVTKVLAAFMMKSWLGAGDIIRILAGGGRIAMVIATGGHFATTVAATRMRRSSRVRARLVRVFPVHMPLSEMVAALNRFRPAMIAAYASVAKLFASEQEAGRLHIKPVLLSAFATASILERHLGYRAAWRTLVVASDVAASRLHDNRHFVSDVVFGSALGMASGWTVVGRHGRREYAVVPVPTRGGFAVAVMWTPGRSAATAEVR